MSTDGGAIASGTIFCGSAPGSAPSSPRKSIKFLCSHGGRILPRPPDGQLKYVGGETRVISVARGITFQELMKKLTQLNDREMTLKYQAVSEDLDALVSVRSDEDVGYMCDEITRCENAGISRLRAFLFPANPIMMENPTGTADPPLEQRYIDAVNGITRTPPKQYPMIANTVQYSSMVSSGCSSPPSPDSCTTEAVSANEPVVLPSNNYHHNGRMMRMHKVHSSPNICGSMSVNTPQQSHHFMHQLPSSQPQQYVHHHPLGPSYPSSTKLPFDLPRSEGRLISVRSVDRVKGVRYQMDPITPAPVPPHCYTSKQNRGGNGCWLYDDCNNFPAERRMAERTASRAMSLVHSGIWLGPGHADNI